MFNDNHIITLVISASFTKLVWLIHLMTDDDLVATIENTMHVHRHGEIKSLICCWFFVYSLFYSAFIIS